MILLANILVQSILQSPDVALQHCPDPDVLERCPTARRRSFLTLSDHWQNLLHQQDIPVVCTICLYSGFNKEQSVQPSCETAADTMTEDRAGPQQALGTNITLLC